MVWISSRFRTSLPPYRRSSLERISRKTPWRGKVQQVLCAFNFTPVVRSEYRLGMPCQGVLR
ncbi:alpha amylase C-terminal domain-containing protein, partial [Bittarella massiliensis (ex Durand et al. 2017)]|uniref:alpha amylase C-terminal domain-containing protein n=1 Tax=Bittarella massiliensis (ex Durand et al. 2017) TaxID=1720313 RepID=UPI0034A02594